MNLRRLFAMAYKELLQIWRDPRSLAVALAMPAMQMVLLGYGVSLDIKHVPLCVHDEENSQISRGLVDRFVASGWFSAVKFVGSDRQAREAVDRDECAGVVTIPVDFTRVLTTTGNASVQAVFDATDTNTTNIAIGYAQGVIAKTTADYEAGWAKAHGAQPPTVGAIDLEPRVWYNEGLDSRDFIIPGVVAVILALVGAQLTSLTISREWERGTMEQLISTPVTALEVMLGKLIPYFLIGAFDAAFCLLAAIFWFDVPFRGSIVTLAFTTGLFTVVVLGIGYLLSVRIRSQLGAKSGRAASDDAADHHALRLHFSDRPDAGADPRHHPRRLCPVLRHDLARLVPQGQPAFGSLAAGHRACGFRGGDHLDRRPRLSQTTGLGAGKCSNGCMSC